MGRLIMYALLPGGGRYPERPASIETSRTARRSDPTEGAAAKRRAASPRRPAAAWSVRLYFFGCGTLAKFFQGSLNVAFPPLSTCFTAGGRKTVTCGGQPTPLAS